MYNTDSVGHFHKLLLSNSARGLSFIDKNRISFSAFVDRKQENLFLKSPETI